MTFKKILCPVDFSEGAREAMRVAAELARSSQAPLALLYVWQAPLWATDYGMRWPNEALLEAQAVEDKKLAAFRAEALERGAPTVSAKLVRGTPWDEIVAAARDDREVDLIVMGTHGRAGLQRALIGSVAERVIRHAPCAVMVVRTRETAARSA
ncbi:MAG TPA: universal stress protein [Kofleriaceae bacterium]|nr:universal stress protein [Kofleriaceae bacterium]